MKRRILLAILIVSLFIFIVVPIEYKLILLLIPFSGGMILLLFWKRIPEGYEDEKGFHRKAVK